MADFGYNHNAIRNKKNFKPIANGNVADSGMIPLTDENQNQKSKKSVETYF